MGRGDLRDTCGLSFPGMNLNHGDTADREVHRVPLVSLCHRGSNEMTKEGFNTSPATKERANISHVLSVERSAQRHCVGMRVGSEDEKSLRVHRAVC